MNLGFIGCGFISQQCHLPSFTEIEDANLLALSDLDSLVREKTAGRFGIPRSYESHTELLADQDVDAVVIVVKRELAFGIIRDALNANKHVLTEKPLCLDPVNAETLHNLATEKKRLLSVGYMKRHDLGVKSFREFLLNKMKQGTPYLISIKHYGGDSYWNPINQVRSQTKIEDSISFVEPISRCIDTCWHPAYKRFLNTYSHSFDLIEYLFGGSLHFCSKQIDKNGFGISTFELILNNKSETQVPVSFHSAECNTSDWNDSLEIIFPGLKAKLELPPPLLRNVPAKWSTTQGNGPQSITTTMPKPSWAFVEQARDFVKLIESKDAIVDQSAINQVKLVSSIFS